MNQFINFLAGFLVQELSSPSLIILFTPTHFYYHLFRPTSELQCSSCFGRNWKAV